MQVNVRGKGVTVTGAMRDAVSEKTKVLEKFLEDRDVFVNVRKRKIDMVVNVRFVYDGKFTEVSKSGEDFYFILDEVVDALKVKLKKLHGQRNKRLSAQEKELQRIGTIYDEEDSGREAKPVISKYKKFVLKPMFEEEAVYQMEALGHPSYIFKNAEKDDAVCMVYRRSDGRYGVIEVFSV